MKKISKSRFYPVLVLGMLTLLIVSSSIYASSTMNPSMLSLETSPVTLQTMAENNILRWNITWGGTGEESGNGVAVDASGDIYCVGYTTSFGAVGSNLALVKVDSNSTRLWNITWGGTGEEGGNGVAVDASGDIYCVGYTTSFGAGGTDLALVKVDSNGKRLWNTTWGGTSYEEGKGVAVDSSGSIYCVGITYSFGPGTPSSTNLALVKFAPNGTQLWNTTWGGDFNDNGRGVAVDTSGSVYCIGDTDNFGAVSTDLALIKVASNGTRLWNVTWGGTRYDYGRGVAADASGFVYCVGDTNSFGVGDFNFALVKMAPNGTRLWNVTWGGTSGDDGEGVAVDTSGSVYCVGETQSFGAGATDIALVKFDSHGTLLWNTTWGGAGYETGYSVAVDTSGSVYCAGDTSSFGAGTTDFAVVKFSYPAGGGGPGGIPGFDLFYLLCGLLAIIYLVQRRKSPRLSL